MKNSMRRGKIMIFIGVVIFILGAFFGITLAALCIASKRGQGER
jgi:hypothetical protein